ncbi:hypothetical protein Glove_158g43 [Diversispora epigaea]|uniref:Uncharacterized protein n=1 Tax=Diversispora epigaea TaxID=1348612 RepID=A0A397IRN1_9GLOM|nr:hypothetical protein Glove_158g43 [Diversispora epigaea]
MKFKLSPILILIFVATFSVAIAIPEKREDFWDASEKREPSIWKRQDFWKRQEGEKTGFLGCGSSIKKGRLLMPSYIAAFQGDEKHPEYTTIILALTQFFNPQKVNNRNIKK